jgi:hypothetical protein
VALQAEPLELASERVGPPIEITPRELAVGLYLGGCVGQRVGG